jgi:uncharacterized glyoxalase superfamily metalloenzyme YdcJ
MLPIAFIGYPSCTAIFGRSAEMPTAFVSPDVLRGRFAHAMSQMYRREVPLYGDLLGLVSKINAATLAADPQLAESLRRSGDLARLEGERHGAIRVGTPAELATLRRLFAVFGMQPVGYYDLTSAGVPVHSTAFRAVHEESLRVSPFRVFTSLLRLELIDQPSLRAQAAQILARRQIFTPLLLTLIERFETQGGLSEEDGQAFIEQALQTFCWHREATVTADQYHALHEAHRLIADVVAFKGPHINHLTPRTLDIDRVQAAMPAAGIAPKAVIEGPPTRRHPILLRQTSFKALQEQVTFTDQQGQSVGSHTARFGEIEQRGAALTAKGRALYDRLLAASRTPLRDFPAQNAASEYMTRLSAAFSEFPDDLPRMREHGLAFFRYFVAKPGPLAHAPADDLEDLIAAGHIGFEPLVYEDFLPVSAAGIFQSNLGDTAQADYAAASNREDFERALGTSIIDELQLYAETERRSLEQCVRELGLAHAVAPLRAPPLPHETGSV